MSRLHLRLVLVFFLVLVVVSVLSAALAWFLRPLSPERVQAKLEGQAAILAGRAAELWEDAELLGEWVRRQGAVLDLRITVRDPTLHLVASVGEPLPPQGRGWRGGPGHEGWRGLRVEQPIEHNGKTVGTLSLAPTSPRRLLYPRRPPLLVPILVIGLIVSALALWPISRSLTRRLVDLEAVSTRLAEGDLSARARVRGNDEVDRLARRFNTMASSLEEQRDGRQRFFQAISHELRSPLARMRVALDNLAESPVQGQRFVESAQRDIDEIDTLVGRLLEVARGADGKPELRGESVDVVQLSRALAQPLGLAIETSAAEIVVRADHEVLGRAIRNVLENAARYAGTDHPVELAAAHGEGVVELRFRDRGPGIPETERERVFQPFYRLDTSRDRASGGVGLGLALVRQALEQHGGEAFAEAHPEGGTVLVLRLPMA